jgi:hypothetical protein
MGERLNRGQGDGKDYLTLSASRVGALCPSTCPTPEVVGNLCLLSLGSFETLEEVTLLSSSVAFLSLLALTPALLGLMCPKNSTHSLHPYREKTVGCLMLEEEKLGHLFDDPARTVTPDCLLFYSHSPCISPALPLSPSQEDLN